jgi:DMSO/TMAO reductase YedYZ molybdopterin-dependent catalytic subunit
LFAYNYISAAKLSWIHDFSGLALVALIILHLIAKRKWLNEYMAVKLRMSKKTAKILSITLFSLLAVGIIAYVNIRFFSNKITTNLAAVEVADYNGEKLGSINDFRENSIKGVQYVDKSTYQLDILGLVSQPIKYSYDDILKLPTYQKVVTLNCVEGWSVKALWEGILVRDLLKNITIKPEAKTIIFYAADGYSTSFPLDYVLNNDIIMADKLNGVVLPPERGFPFQLVAEQKWGYKWIKWITKIELSSDTNYKGFWESRGYNNSGDLNNSKFAL